MSSNAISFTSNAINVTESLNSHIRAISHKLCPRVMHLLWFSVSYIKITILFFHLQQKAVDSLSNVSGLERIDRGKIYNKTV